ncbi:LLM class flavin-dependent oxidoreductase [Amphibacillus sp. MSJ-3]|uniref:LLM class flavin-dependent oxidoreductase n=1 Tax=Amphibacillus sp. MSJ-3 TaxID=2841505 RepID=UPI001C0F0764|nr:LLM class flavin-dependent oxidoreductase [Amphibacillus sp. MSJ-3]MBU5593695.1 LLM class flavin-dependent oxidoreductase [Amphibacillus sp. MSJ-3]
MTHLNIPVSVLDLAPIRQGEGQLQAIGAVVELAQATEKMGYQRYWIAEHHNSPTLVSSATAILIKHVLEQTESIRVGSGGIMLPNHAPLVVAEQFGTMATLYPDRVDLGLGRAPGTDLLTASALRRSRGNDAVHTFPSDVQSLLNYFGPLDEQGHVKAFPGVATHVPLYILGSSTDSAMLAAKLGLPYVFASHFAPRHMPEAIEIYRDQFQPSRYLDEPYMIVCLNVIVAETDQEADREMTTTKQFFLNVIRGENQPLKPPVDDIESIWTLNEKNAVQSMINQSWVGSQASVRDQMIDFQTVYDVDEIMAVSYIFDREKQARSYQLLKNIVNDN